MATCAISGTLVDASNTAVASVTVAARVVQPVVSGTNVVVPYEVRTYTDSSGNFTITLQQSISVVFTVYYPPLGSAPMRQYTYSGTIPGTSTASFTNVITIEV